MSHPELPRTQAVGLLKLGRSYVEAAEALGGLQDLASQPRYFLFGHGLELALKSVLVANGVSEAKLKKLGHDLDEIVAELDSRGLLEAGQLVGDDRALVSWLNQYYRDKEFEYLRIGYKEFPHPDDVRAVVNRLLAPIQANVDRTVRAAIRTGQ